MRYKGKERKGCVSVESVRRRKKIKHSPLDKKAQLTYKENKSKNIKNICVAGEVKIEKRKLLWQC